MPAESYELEGTVYVQTALHIGSGHGDERTDATIVRDARGTPYIPGSSLRGVLRSSIEARAPQHLSCRGSSSRPGHCARTEQTLLADTAFAQAQAEARRLTVTEWIADLFRRNGLEEELREGDVTVEKGVKALIAQGFGAEPLLVDLLSETLCATCRLFGSLDWASPLHIPDLYPLSSADDTVPAEITRWLRAHPQYFLASVHGLKGPVRHGVGIDRDTGAAREQIKYDFEVLPGGYTFRFVLRLGLPADLDEQAANDWLGLLAIGVRLLQTGSMTIGGRVARGVGHAWLDLSRVAVVPMEGVALLDAMIAGERDEDGRLRLAPSEEWTTASTPGPDGWVAMQLAALRRGGV